MRKGQIIILGITIYALAITYIFLNLVSSAAAAAEFSIPKAATVGDAGPVTEGWVVLTDMGFKHGHPGVATLDGKIHVVGGFADNHDLDTHEAYDPQTDTWQQAMKQPIRRSDLVLENVGGMLYAIGGWDSSLNDGQGSALADNYVYDPFANTWTAMEPMPTPVSGAGGVVYNDKIYIIGGFDSDYKHSALVQIYDPLHNSWSYGTPLPAGRSGHEAVLLDGKIYAIGGNRSEDGSTSYTSDVVEVYDPNTNTWSDGEPLPEARVSMAAGVRNGKIYVMGGANVDKVPQDTTFVFDPGTGEWSTEWPMPTARVTCGAAVVGDYIYVVGGVGGTGRVNEAFGYELMFLPMMSK